MTSPPSSPIPQALYHFILSMVALDNTYGVLLIGVVVAAILYGFTCIQTWYYYIHHPSDPWYTKLLVAAALVSETLHQAMITHSAYIYLITNFGVPGALNNVVWSMVAEVFFNGLTTFLVKCFLTMRVYRLSKKNWLTTGLVLIFVIAEFLVTTIFGIKASGLHTYSEIATLKSLSLSVNVLAAAGDIFIAVLLCYLLQASRTGFRRSETLINKLIVFNINTGLVTSFCALASLISITVWPNTWIYMAFFFCIGRLYCNSLLTTLNGRARLRNGSRGDESHSLQSHSGQQKTNDKMIRTSSKRMPNNISIKIDTTQEYIRDERYSLSSGDAKVPEVV